MPPKKNKPSGGPGRSPSRGRSPAPNPFNAFNEEPKPKGVRPAHLNEANKKVRDFMAMTGLPYRQAQQTLKNLRSKSGSMPASRGRSISRASSRRGSVAEESTVAAPAPVAAVNKTKRTRAKGPWNAHLNATSARMKANNPKVTRQEVMKEAGRTFTNRKAKPAAATSRGRSASRGRSVAAPAPAPAPYNPFNDPELFGNEKPNNGSSSAPFNPFSSPELYAKLMASNGSSSAAAPAPSKNKTRKSKKSTVNASGAGSAAAPVKQKRTRTKGPWNAHVNATSARMKAENPKVTRQEVLKEAGRTYSGKGKSVTEQLGIPAGVANNNSNSSNSNSSVNLLNFKGSGSA